MHDGQRRDGQPAAFKGIVPIELHHILEAARGEKLPEPQRHDDGHALFAGQPGKRALVEMVVVIVADDQIIDRRQIADRDTALHIALRAEPGGARITRQIRVGENDLAVEAQKKRGMAEPGQKIALLDHMVRKRAVREGAGNDMPVRHLHRIEALADHAREKRQRAFDRRLTAHGAAGGIAEPPARQMMPGPVSIRPACRFMRAAARGRFVLLHELDR